MFVLVDSFKFWDLSFKTKETPFCCPFDIPFPCCVISLFAMLRFIWSTFVFNVLQLSFGGLNVFCVWEECLV